MPAADVLAHPRSIGGQLRMLKFGVSLLREMDSQARALSAVLEGADPGTAASKDPADRSSAWVEVILDDHGVAVLWSR